jgi:hypothetical protein
MESRFFVSMKWLPAGFPGSVAWLALALSADGMESPFFVSMKWLPTGFLGSVALLALLAFLALSAEGMESRFFVSMKFSQDQLTCTASVGAPCPLGKVYYT